MPTSSDDLISRLRQDPKLRSKLEKRVAESLLSGMLSTAIAHGNISAKDKTEAELLQEIAEALRSAVKAGGVTMTVDHTKTLYELAQEHEQIGKTYVAIVLYATWVEHTLNYLVTVGVARMGHPDRVAKEAIRDASLSGKIGWLLPLLGFKAISKPHADKLRKLADLRNQFVHYKWNYLNLDESHAAEQADRAFLRECRASLRYLAGYRTRQTFGGTSGKVKRAIGSASKA